MGRSATGDGGKNFYTVTLRVLNIFEACNVHLHSYSCFIIVVTDDFKCVYIYIYIILNFECLLKGLCLIYTSSHTHTHTHTHSHIKHVCPTSYSQKLTISYTLLL